MHSIQTTYNTVCLYVIITQAFIKKLTDSDDLVPRQALRGPLVWPLAARVLGCTRAGLHGVRAYLQRHHKITLYFTNILFYYKNIYKGISFGCKKKSLWLANIHIYPCCYYRYYCCLPEKPCVAKNRINSLFCCFVNEQS